MTGEQLRRLRKMAGLNQSEIAIKVGYERSAIARMELGDRIIPGPVARMVRKIVSDICHKNVTVLGRIELSQEGKC